MFVCLSCSPLFVCLVVVFIFVCLITSFKSDKEHCLTDVCIIYVCIFVCLFVVNLSVSIACLSSSVSFGFLDPLTHILQYGRLQRVRGGGGGGGDHGCGREGAQKVRYCL